jgi:3-hydroxyisobutyrate dehydrogenase
MGTHMARNLHRAGLLAGVWNRTRARADAFAAETGVVTQETPAALAAACDAIVLCVSADADVCEIVDRMSPALRSGQALIDCSTIASQTARGLATRLAAQGVDFIDAPVSGGVEGARQGSIAIMCGGDAAVVERLRPVLAAMGRTVALMGAVGTGQATKATNQILCAGVIQAVAQAMAFAQAEQLPLTRVIDVLSQGAGASWYFTHRAPYMVDGRYPPGFRVALHAKDLRICRDMAAARGLELSVIDDLLAAYEKLMRSGSADEDISAIFRLQQPGRDA